MTTPLCSLENQSDSSGMYRHYCPVCHQSFVSSVEHPVAVCRGTAEPAVIPRDECPVVTTQKPDGQYEHWCPQCNRTQTTNRPRLRQRCTSKGRGRCRFLGDQRGTVPCETCGGTAEVDVFSCHLHSVCTVRQLVRGIAYCGTCHDYRPEDGVEADQLASLAERPDVYLFGYPGDIGGAGTEAWHTIKLWRRERLRVVAIPTWGRHGRWEQKVEATGTITLPVSATNLGRVPGLPGSTIVSFCNDQFLKYAPQLHAMGCKLVWANCMNWMFPAEKDFYETYQTTFDAYLFQSAYQQSKLGPQLAQYGAGDDQFHLIRGAFDVQEFPFHPSPRQPGQPITVGRLARADLDKWSPRLWRLYEQISPDRRALVMGWSPQIEQKCGTQPLWAETYSVGAMSAQDFIQRLHILVPLNDTAQENWPRVGLEAMSTGVPIVAPNRWGWRELIVHGKTGFLADNEEELVAYAKQLAEDEPLRLSMAVRARQHLEQTLAEPVQLGKQWRTLLRSVQGSTIDGSS